MKAIGKIMSVVLILTVLANALAQGALSGDTDPWKTKAPLPMAFEDSGVIGGKIYGFGHNVTCQYDPATDRWQLKSPMPTYRDSFSAAACQGKIYVFGGLEWMDKNGTYHNSAANQAYDPSTDSWENMASLPTARSQMEANVVNAKIYLIGGRTGGQYTTVDVNEVYDPATDTWATKAPIPYPVVQYASAVVDGKIYILGGQDEFNKTMNLALVQIYNPATDTWSFGTPMPNVVWQAAAGATSGNLAPKRIYLIGGLTPWQGSGWHRPKPNYDPYNDSWTVGTPMPTARFMLEVAVLNDKIYSMGGSPYFMGGWSNKNEQYSPLEDAGAISPTEKPTDSPTAISTPTPTVPELSWLRIVPLLLTLVSFVVVKLFRKHK